MTTSHPASRALYAAAQSLESLEPRQLLSASPQVFTASGNVASAAALSKFEATIGGNDNVQLPPQATGRRTINWDGVKLDGTDFNNNSQVIVKNKVVGIPVNRFQARGVIFAEVYAVSGDGFVSVNPGAKGQLNAFSAKNIFAMFNETDIELHFVVPSAPTTKPVSAASRGFGAIFLDVEKPNTSYMEFFDGSTLLGKFFAPVGASGQAEFVGALFPSAVVTSVEIVPGTATLFSVHHNTIISGPADLSNGGTADLAAVDDFAYAEPVRTTAFANRTVTSPIMAGGIATLKGTIVETNPLDSFTLTTYWGDGSPVETRVFPPGSNGQVVTLTHRYLNARHPHYNVALDWRDPLGGGNSANLSVQVNPFAITAVNFSGQAGSNSTGTVATFTDFEAGSKLAVVIDWGDGRGSIGEVVSDGGGKFQIVGSHVYSEANEYHITVFLRDNGGYADAVSAAATITSSSLDPLAESAFR